MQLGSQDRCAPLQPGGPEILTGLPHVLCCGTMLLVLANYYLADVLAGETPAFCIGAQPARAVGWD